MRKEFIQPFPAETFHRPPDTLFEGFRIFPRRGKCWTYLGKSPKKVLKLNLAVEMVVWRYNFVIGKIKLSMLKRCRGEVVWTNSMTWILTRSHWSCAIDDDDVSDHKQEINLSQGSTRTICTVWYSVFFGGLAFKSPAKIWMQNFVFTVLFGHYLDPPIHWNHINIFFSRVGFARSNVRLTGHPNIYIYVWCMMYPIPQSGLSVFNRSIWNSNGPRWYRMVPRCS